MLSSDSAWEEDDENIEKLEVYVYWVQECSANPNTQRLEPTQVGWVKIFHPLLFIKRFDDKQCSKTEKRMRREKKENPNSTRVVQEIW